LYIYISILPTVANPTMTPRGQALLSVAVVVLIYSSCLYVDYMHKNKTCTTYIFISNLVVTLPCIVVHVRVCKNCLFHEPKVSQIGDVTCIRRLYHNIKQVLLFLLGLGISVNTLSIFLWPYTLQRIDSLQCERVIELVGHSVVTVVTYAGVVILTIPSIAYTWKSILWNVQCRCHPCCIPCLNQCSKCSQRCYTNEHHDQSEV
jgi:hypothetical protein